MDSALFSWSYRIALPVAESAPFPMWATLLLAFVLLVLALCARDCCIAYFACISRLCRCSPGWAFSIPLETSSRR